MLSGREAQITEMIRYGLEKNKTVHLWTKSPMFIQVTEILNTSHNYFLLIKNNNNDECYISWESIESVHISE